MAKAPEQANHITGTNRGDTSSEGTGAIGWVGRLGQVFGARRPVVDVSTLDGKRGANGASATSQASDVKRSPWDIRPKSQLGKLVFGMLIYFLGSQLLEVGLALVFSWLKLSVSARQTLFPPNTWIVGGLTNFSLIYFVLIALFVWALFRFNVIPRDFLRPASQQRGTTRGQGISQSGANGNSANANGSKASRHSGRQRLVMTTPTTKPKRTPAGALRTRSTATTTTTTKAVAPRANGKAPAPPPADESYERVKAQQRARRRKR